MSDLSEEVRLARLRRKRKVLRALNGAGLGVLLGGLIGAFLGMLTMAIFLPKNPLRDSAFFGGLYGVLPGMFGGFWIGMTVVLRDGTRGVAAGTAAGAVVGAVYGIVLGKMELTSLFLFGFFTIPCGVVGGLVLSLLIRAVRARWGWWTRWEE